MATARSLPETRSRNGLMDGVKYLAFGAYFGFVLTKAEVISWYRIQEMFRFQSFHMYGVIGMAVLVGVLSVWLIKRYNVRAIDGSAITFADKELARYRYIVGGTIFGLGWALTGACPGPVAALIGSGYTVVLVVLASAVFGTWVYGLLRPRLPH